jgi:transposase-like protein
MSRPPKGSGISGVRYTEAQRDEWARWYRGGATVEEICRRSGATRHTVTRWLKHAGVKLRGNPRSFDRSAILRELKQGAKSQAAIARQFGCSQRLVSDLAVGKIKP